MRWVLILAGVCLALVVVLALTRTGDRPRMTEGPPPAAEPAPAVQEAAKPAAAVAPAPKEEAPPAKAEPTYSQVDEDAAAVGMTTRESSPEQASPEAPTEKKEP
jgi:hypothetical protein